MTTSSRFVGLRGLVRWTENLQKNKIIVPAMACEYIASHLRRRVIDLVRTWRLDWTQSRRNQLPNKSHVLNDLYNVLMYLDGNRLEEPEWWQGLLHEVRVGLQDVKHPENL